MKKLLELYNDVGENLDFDSMAVIFTFGLLVSGFFFFQLIPSAKIIGNIINVIWMLIWLPLMIKAVRRKGGKNEA